MKKEFLWIHTEVDDSFQMQAWEKQDFLLVKSETDLKGTPILNL